MVRNIKAVDVGTSAKFLHTSSLPRCYSTMSEPTQVSPPHEGVCLCGASKVIVETTPTFNVCPISKAYGLIIAIMLADRSYAIVKIAEGAMALRSALNSMYQKRRSISRGATRSSALPYPTATLVSEIRLSEVDA